MKRTLVALLLLVFATTAFAGGNDITPENIVALMNVERAAMGLGPLKLDARLARAAEDRMRDMEEGGWWSHESPEGRSPFVWLAVRAYDYEFAGENLAAGFETANVLVTSWMESRGHRENILNANYDECGIAIIDGSTIHPANGKSIVVMFGKRFSDEQRALRTLK
ncbi:MAG TPA: CAP domain-containing protein [Thermoanaerobaculia bacterium]|nr:CAP domain-containing protein [Thermoanaerobaculia bacterium]